MKKLSLLLVLLLLLIASCKIGSKEEIHMQIPTWDQVKTVNVPSPAWRQKFATPDGCTLVVKQEKDALEEYVANKKRYLSTAKQDVWVIMKQEKEKEFFLEYEFEDAHNRKLPRVVVFNKAIECVSTTYAAEFYCALDAAKQYIGTIEESLDSLKCT